MLMPWGCTVRESALNVDSGRKKALAALWTGTRVSIVPGFSVGRCGYPAPPSCSFSSNSSSCSEGGGGGKAGVGGGGSRSIVEAVCKLVG